MSEYIIKIRRWYVDPVLSVAVIETADGRSFILPDGFDIHNSPLGESNEYIVKNTSNLIIDPYTELKEIKM